MLIAIIIVHDITNQPLPSYLLANVGPEPEEFPVDPVESRLQEVPLARVLRVEEIEQVQDELLVDVPLHQRWLRDVNLRISLDDPRIAFASSLLSYLKVGGFEHPEEEFVHELEVGPRGLQRRLVLLRIELENMVLFRVLFVILPFDVNCHLLQDFFGHCKKCQDLMSLLRTSAPLGFVDGGSARKRLTLNMATISG